MLPATIAARNVTTNTRPICPNETPPNRAVAMNTGSDAPSKASTLSKPASSLPKTSSLLVSRVKSSRISVRRSFSWATALAANKAENETANTNCTTART